jgi:hypothetical protein
MAKKLDDAYLNLVKLFKMFKNRPNHLVKYLLDNDSFNKNFLEALKDNDKLKKINLNKANSYFVDNNIKDPTPIYFTDIESMNLYFNSLSEETKHIKSPTKLRKEFNKKLKNALSNEEYMEAAKIRDYMKKNNILINLK